MAVETVVKDGLEYTTVAFASGLLLHCFYDDRIKITLRRLGVIFLVTVLLSFADSLIESRIGTGVLMMPFVFVCPAVVLQWGIKADLQGVIKRIFGIIGTEVMLAIYSLELVMLGASLAGMSDVAAKAGMREGSESTGFYIAYLTVMLLIGIGLYFLIVQRGEAMLFRGSDLILTLAMGVIILLSLGLFLYIDANETLKLYRLGLDLIMLLLLMIMPLMIYKNRQSAYFNEVSIHNKEYLEAELAASKLYHEAQEETRAFRHDMRNNLNLLAGLLSEKNYEEAQRHIADLTGGLAALSPRIVTGDEMLDSLISSKLAELDRQGIELTVNGVIEGGLGWKPIDICAVFANALDNAMEACRSMQEESNRYIRISFRKTELQRVISIYNSMNEETDCSRLLSADGRYTTKEDKGRHGYGLRNIRRTVEKYGGIVKLDCRDKEFRLTIVLT